MRPPIELVAFPEAQLSGFGFVSGEVRAALCVAGVPASFFGGARYAATPALRGPVIRDERVFVVFGTEDGRELGVDLASGEVMELAAGAGPSFVNTSLRQFTDTVRGVTDRFPYYPRNAAHGLIEAAVRDLRSIVSRIDDRALRPSSFWSAFLDDVLVGDFATEDVDSYLLTATDAWASRAGERWYFVHRVRDETSPAGLPVFEVQLLDEDGRVLAVGRIDEAAPELTLRGEAVPRQVVDAALRREHFDGAYVDREGRVVTPFR